MNMNEEFGTDLTRFHAYAHHGLIQTELFQNLHSRMYKAVVNFSSSSDLQTGAPQVLIDGPLKRTME